MSKPSTAAMDWDVYWRGSADGTAFGTDGVEHPLVSQFWTDLLTALRKDGQTSRLLDVASGRGAVIDIARTAFGEDNISVTCLDTSEWAIKSLVERFPSAEGVVGDAKNMPFPDNSFDIATSQFGVEYAGIEAIDEMVRIVAPQGTIAFLMHIKDGMIDSECAQSISAIDDLSAINFLPAATLLFTEARKCVKGETNGSRDDFDAAVRNMAPIYREFTAIMEKHGDGAAGGTLSILYRETDRIHGRIMHHDLDEVLQWLARLGEELGAYKGRMQSMCDAANDAHGFEQIATRLSERGFRIAMSGPLHDAASKRDVAWQLIATRTAT